MSLWLPAAWPSPPGVQAGTTLRRGFGRSQPPFDRANLGRRCGDDPEAVRHNHDALRQGLRLPEAPRWLRQVHGVVVMRDPGHDEPEADAAVTGRAGTVLAVLTADCLPVVFAARDGSEVAVAHAGWRGLAAGVLESTVQAMSTPPPALQAWLGPCAGAQRYEIGPEVRHAFLSVDAQADAAFRASRPGHWWVNLPLLARQRLSGAGVQAERVFGEDACTISDDSRFFSHRRDRRTGRMATLAWRSHPATG